MSLPKTSPLCVVAAGLAALALAAGCSGQPQGSGAIPGELPIASRPSASSTIAITIVAPAPPASGKPIVALGLELDGKAKTFQPVNLRTSNSVCVGKRGTFSCSVSMAATSGAHWLTVDGYDAFIPGKKAPKNAVSTNGVPINAIRAKTTVQLELSPAVNGITVSPISSEISGNVKNGFTIDRSTADEPSTFAIYGINAAGKIVVGPGTSSFTLKPSNANFALTTPDTNQFVLDASAVTAAATSTIVATTAKGTKCPKSCKLSFSVTVTAVGTSPSPSASPSTMPSTSASPSAPPSISPSPSAPPTPAPAAIFVTYSTGASSGTVGAFDEQGHSKTLSGSWANLGQASTIAYDSANAWFYVLTGVPSAPITSYDVSGNQIALSGSFTSTPVALTADGSHNHLFVPTHVGASDDTILGYDEEGNALTLTPGFILTTLVAAGPNAIAYDPDNSHLYFANSSSGKIEEYDTSGNSINVSTQFAQPTACGGGCVPTAVMYAHFDVWPYVIWKNGSQYYIAYYESNGSMIGSFTPTVAAPSAMASDDNDREIYIVGGTSVEAADEFGSVKSTTGNFTAPSGATAATGIAVVPPSGALIRRAVRANHPRR